MELEEKGKPDKERENIYVYIHNVIYRKGERKKKGQKETAPPVLLHPVGYGRPLTAISMYST